MQCSWNPNWPKCVFSAICKMITFKFIILLCVAVIQCIADTKYTPDWKSLDTRPLPQWYDDAKFGIFLHWGVYSVPSFGSEWFWNYLEVKKPEFVEFMQKRYKPGFTYQEFAKDFTAEFYNATQWTELFQAAGAKYVVLTSKHHEGYTLWPSKYSFSWNAKDVGPHRDLIDELATAVKKTDIKFGLYHSLFEWYNPLWMNDKKKLFTTNKYVTSKVMPELKELVETYKPEVVWSDGDAEGPDAYWKSREFLSWLYNDSPVKDTVVTNDRWGLFTACKHGDFYTCADRYNPGTLQKHKWENAMTIDRKSWGYRRNAQLEDYMSLEELIKELVSTVSCNGNLLMNVGPTKDGIIAPIFEERLRGMGQWLQVNGEAIYNTRPWNHQNDTLNGDIWYTMSRDGSNVYASILSWPDNNTLKLGAVKSISDDTKVSLLGINNILNWTRKPDYLEVHLPLSAHRGKPAWVLRFENYKEQTD